MTTPFRCHVLTWNVAETEPPKDMTYLLKVGERYLPNIFAIGLQEIPSSAGNLINDGLFDDPWTNAFTTVLSRRGYVRVKSIRLLATHLVVYIRHVDLPYISNVESAYLRTGFGGAWGNKGAVSVRMDISGVSVCFLNCHFAAHLPEVATRIWEFNNVVESMEFQNKETSHVLDHDYVVWFGDLNFRLDDVPREEVIKRVASMDRKYLVQYDQLGKLMKEGVIFADFEEGPLHFDPTFKYDMNTDEYDTSKKQRKPAWCDRILWLVHADDAYEGVKLGVKQYCYTARNMYKTSDHKPVVSEMDLQVLDVAPQLPVFFALTPKWCSSKDNTVHYSIDSSFPVSAWDWIGIYKRHYHHTKNYETYVWASSKPETSSEDYSLQLPAVKSKPNKRHRYTVKFHKNYLSNLIGEFYLCYYSSKKDAVVGYSELFKITLTEAEAETSSSSSSDDSD